MATPREAIEETASEQHWREPYDPGLTPILTHSLDAFYEHGYAATSVRDIAKRVGVTVPTLYYHHDNKEGILWALLDNSINRLYDLCVEARDEGSTPVERFSNVVECLTVYVASTQKLASLDSEIRSLTARNRRIYAGRRARIEAVLVGTIEAGVTDGEFSVADTAGTGRALLGMIQAITLWYRAGRDAPIAELVLDYLDIAAHTVGARPEVIAALTAR